MQALQKELNLIRRQMQGDLLIDEVSRILYSTDASAYREMPLAVALPKTEGDLKILIKFANNHKVTLIPRTAGTSLAGQVVGNGIVVDVSKYWNRILEINPIEHWVKVLPGVVLDELNQVVEKQGLFFGPETSTSNRCMIGGMVGNNSCGAHSIIYGSVRDHLLEVKALLSDGSEVTFSNLTNNKFSYKCKLNTLEGQIYRNISELLSDSQHQEEIRKEFPDQELKRRNNGYAVDLLLETQPFTNNNIPFNFCKLIAGSEGTLAFITEIKLNLLPLPPKVKGVICVHMNSVEEALHANLIALKYEPGAVELMDKVILDCTKGNLTQQRNRFFVEGEPGAILIIEFARETKEEISTIYENLVSEFKLSGYGYHFPILFGADINKVWALRKSGLGALSNIQGDAKAVSVIEDTAVHPRYLPDYISDFNQMLQKYQLSCVYHAHIGSGELHLRPVLNLKKQKDIDLFRTVAWETAKLVKKYKGSLSGEHGDGRLRGEFIPLMIGERNYRLCQQLKKTWDPNNIFNANKIVDTPPMNSQLRYTSGVVNREIKTYFDFSKQQGILRAAENCNGSADCRKSHLIGGTMCPSFMATRDEKSSTRARANILREYLTQSTKSNPFNHNEIYEVMDLCLSCKGCKSECPSNVDITKLKAEFLQHYYDANGVPLRSLAIAYIHKINKITSLFPQLYNASVNSQVVSGMVKKVIGFAKERSLPTLSKQTLNSWAKLNLKKLNSSLANTSKRIWFFVDEFTNYNDAATGIIALKLLSKLGYYIEIPKHIESGRTFLSKGLIRKAKEIAIKNVTLLSEKVTSDIPLVGIEPSCILTFRDEYPDLVPEYLRLQANTLGKSTLFIDEFIAREMDNGHILSEWFTKDVAEVKFHGHCQQKALISSDCTRKILTLPANYKVSEIKSGCCGMAGSFGYEKEHYNLSMKIGELVLFPEIRSCFKETILAAPGMSCRQHIKDGTGRLPIHPVEVLWEALNRE